MPHHPHRTRVLVVDDEPLITEWLQVAIAAAPSRVAFEVKASPDGASAKALHDAWRPHVVLLDLRLPDVDGLDLLRHFKSHSPGADGAEVIVVSGEGSTARALEAGQAGAFYFLDKAQLDPSGLATLLERAAALQQERAQLARRDLNFERKGFAGVVGKSKKMRELCDLVEAVAASEANVLIHGENGTGKELIANALHARSLRASGPFIKINCAAIPRDLIESELFGYKKGAFTGAAQDKVGLLELAGGGSLMLDEIGEMPAILQTKLLRVLQEREFRPVGSDHTAKVDFRLICATNIDVEQARRDGRLREDLYFRINTIQLRVPPLRERSEDLALLATYFLAQFNERYRKQVVSITPAAYRLLVRNRWAGNVRELENAIERAVLVARGPDIQPHDLPEPIRDEGSGGQQFAIPPHHTLAEVERMTILQTLQRTNWNKQEAAQILGLYRPTLYSKMRKHNIEDPNRAPRAAPDHSGRELVSREAEGS